MVNKLGLQKHWQSQNSLLMIVCLVGFVTDQIMIVVSNEPLATSKEFGDQAIQLTRALWKPHSLLWAGYSRQTHFNLLFNILKYIYLPYNPPLHKEPPFCWHHKRPGTCYLANRHNL